MKSLVRILIRGYQWIISPVLHFIGGPGSGCRFTPTCSQYFLEAVEAHGFFRGSWMGTKRLLRCNPWGGTGHDPVPPAPGKACNDPHTTAHCTCDSSASGHKSPPAESE